MTDDEINDLWVKIIATNNMRTQVYAFARAINYAERERCAELELLRPLVQEVLIMATEALLPDGDSVNMPTLLWAEDWMRKLRRGPECYTQDELDAAEEEGRRIAKALNVE